MNNARIDKLYNNNIDEKAKDFRPMSDYIVNKYVKSVEGKELTQEARENISFISSVDMAMGSESTKVKYLIIGSLIGIAGTVTLLQIKKKFKKKEEA